MRPFPQKNEQQMNAVKMRSPTWTSSASSFDSQEELQHGGNLKTNFQMFVEENVVSVTDDELSL